MFHLLFSRSPSNKVSIKFRQISMGYENRVATLILKNVTQAQEGTYYCHATNVHGTTVLPSEVKVVPGKLCVFESQLNDVWS